MSKPFKFKRIEPFSGPRTPQEAEMWLRGIAPTRQVTEDDLRDERPIVWPVGAMIPTEHVK